MSLTPELITAISSALVALGAVAKSHYQTKRAEIARRGERERVAAQVKKDAAEAFETLFREERERLDEERQQREEERERHLAELHRIHDEHRSEVERIETESRAACEAAWIEREKKLEEKHETQVKAWRADMTRLVTYIARLIAQLDPSRTPTPGELDRLREALGRADMSPADINGVIATRGVAGI